MKSRHNLERMLINRNHIIRDRDSTIDAMYAQISRLKAENADLRDGYEHAKSEAFRTLDEQTRKTIGDAIREVAALAGDRTVDGYRPGSEPG